MQRHLPFRFVLASLLCAVIWAGSSCAQDDNYAYLEPCKDLTADECGSCCTSEKYSGSVYSAAGCGCQNTIPDSEICSETTDFSACETCCFDLDAAEAVFVEDSCICEIASLEPGDD